MRALDYIRDSKIIKIVISLLCLLCTTPACLVPFFKCTVVPTLVSFLYSVLRILVSFINLLFHL